jgi:hypothetical protein
MYFDGNWSHETKQDGSVVSTVTGRTRRRWWLKFFPLWWLCNSDDPLPPDWYLPGKWEPWRVVGWYLRNPLHNGNFYVWGVADRDYSLVTRWNKSRRVYWSFINVVASQLPFLSYESERLTIHLGWQMHGDLRSTSTAHGCKPSENRRVRLLSAAADNSGPGKGTAEHLAQGPATCRSDSKS